jgi:acetoin utilization deacetylase AcuC-like enzyme
MSEEGYPVLAGRVKPAFEYLRTTGTLDAKQILVEEAVEVHDELLLQVHSANHIQRVKNSGYGSASLVSGGAAVRAGQAVWNGEVRNAFVFTGCAGHHASQDSAWGFCYFNNSALLIRHLQQTYHVKRFFIVDTDPHPGDGTRNILGEDPDIYHLNFEASFYEEVEVISERHVDVPFPGNCGDEAFIDALRRLVPPLTKRSRAQMILWNMGHDAHALDYGGFHLSLRAFPVMTEILMAAADRHCQGRLVVLLSGGSEVLVAQHAISGIVRTLAGLQPLPNDTAEETVTESADTKRTAKNLVDTILRKLNQE